MAHLELLELPAELLNNVLASLDADDVIAFGRTCIAAHRLVTPTNTILWRNVFLNSYDDPHHAWETLTETPRTANKDAENKWDWFSQLRQRRIVAGIIDNGGELVQMTGDYTEAILVLLDIVDTAKSRPTSLEAARGIEPQVDDRRTLNLALLAKMCDQGRENLERIIHARQMEAFVRAEARIDPNRPTTRSTFPLIRQPAIAARLHLCHGMTKMEQNGAPRLRGAARRMVYDWALTGSTTDFGPFELDGSGAVNWQLLEAVGSTISRNFRKCADGRVAIPEGFAYSIPYRIPVNPTVPLDWAGVQGAWLGTYAFLDYADLYQFNVGHRPGQRPSLDDEPEACGDLMRLELELNENLKTDFRLQTDLPVCGDLPMLYFSGESKGHDGAYRPSIGVRGTASLVPGGREVRWRYLINYGGADQWQLEGVQPGGVRSGGVYGLWSHCDHTENGPVGPFCYFPDELCKPSRMAMR